MSEHNCADGQCDHGPTFDDYDEVYGRGGFAQMRRRQRRRFERTVRARVQKQLDTLPMRSDEARDLLMVLSNDDAMDELCARLWDSRGVSGKLSDFVDWLIALDWDRIASIVKLIVSLFA